ncbi:MAG TPA: chemotaxis protein CheB, partial [Methanoregula sp.]|nr:chemotaxis protein CheB [Methanoregula sp.]
MKKPTGTKAIEKKQKPSAAAASTQKKVQKKQKITTPPIIGIGASAGGLEAIEQFLSKVPRNTSMAFVVIQHLDPDYKGIMPEILQRSTPLRVVQVTDRTKIVGNHVYVIPPNKDMSILHGVLHLLEPKEPRGLRLPIDFFLSSLAADQKEKSIGVILSGMGSDGTAGLRAIHEAGGLTLVQDPATAAFDGMPKSAIEAQLADIVTPPSDMPDKIAGFVRLTPHIGIPEPVIEQKSKTALEKIVILLRAQTGHDFSQYKKSTMYRRIERRMGIHQIDRIQTYVRYLQENPRELDLLFKELLIGVTSFFRDPVVWEKLKETILPDLIEKCSDGRTLRAWVAGCSTGEEAYSLAIVIREAMEQVKPNARITLQIYATDLDKDAIDRARSGVFPPNIVADVSSERLSRYFTKEDNGGYRIAKEIREAVVFAPQNLIMDPPFTKLDILSCRNLLIYLEPELQKKLIPLFHYALNPGGILILGNAETVSGYTSMFRLIDPKLRIYAREEGSRTRQPVDFPIRFLPIHEGVPSGEPAVRAVANLQSLTDQLILQRYSPAAVLTNESGDIIYIHGKTGKYLEPAAGRVNWNIFAMAREGLRFELNKAFQEVVRTGEKRVVRSIQVQSDVGTLSVDLEIEVLREPRELSGNVLIVFSDMTALKKQDQEAVRKTGKIKSAVLQEMERERQQSLEEIQSLKEEMQTSQEELKSTNEELQSTNEELQSTNEELTTSKEELQSLN